jgi:hypothetical protein
VEKIIDWESKPTLEEGGEHHDFIGVEGWSVFTGGGAPLQHLMVMEKVVHGELTDLAFIND